METTNTLIGRARPQFDHQAGDLGPTMDAEARALAVENMPIARRWARKFADRYPHMADDFESEAMFGLCIEACSYGKFKDKEHFAHSLSSRLKHRLIDLIRASRCKGYRSCRPEAEQQPRRLSIVFDSVASRDEPVPAEAERAEAKEAIRGGMSRISSRSADYLRARFMDGNTMRGAAKALSIAPGSTGRIEREALDQLREALEPYRADLERAA